MDLQKFFRIMKKIFFLPPIPTLLIAVPSFVLVIWVLVNEPVNPVISYFSYVLSAYAMIITVTGVAGLVKWIWTGLFEHPLVKKLLGFSLVDRYLRESIFRAEISLYPGLLINLFYAGIKLFSGICYRSVWFGTLAVYYILLAVMRFSLLHHVRTKGIGKKKQRIYISGNADLSYGAVYFLCCNFSGHERDKVQKIRESGDVCGKGHQSDRSFGIHAFVGNSNADTVWRSKKCSFQTEDVSDYRYRSVYGRSWNGRLYDHSDNNTDKKM